MKKVFGWVPEFEKPIKITESKTEKFMGDWSPNFDYFKNEIFAFFPAEPDLYWGRKYLYLTDKYDRMICTSKDHRGEPMPGSYWQQTKSQKNALDVMEDLVEESGFKKIEIREQINQARKMHLGYPYGFEKKEE